MPHLPYRSVIIYDEQTLLLGIDGAGVCAVTRDAKASWSFLNANQEEEGELKGNGIYALCKDSSSNLWIGSYTGGVACANPKRYFFELTRHEYKNPQSLTNNHVNAILEDNEGDLWYATNQGISVHLTKSGNWKHFLKENVFLTLCNDGDGNVWTGGYGTGVYCLNKHTGIRRHLTTDQSGTLTTNYIYSILKDENNKDLWLGGMYGNLVKYTPSQAGKAEEFTSYDITLINSITQVNKDTPALATANGLYLLDKQTGNFRQYFTSPSNADTRSNSFIYSMYFPAPDKVWFGTDGGGINLLDLKTGKAVTYSTADGLPSNYVYSILPDNKGHLWLSTDKGLAYITPSPTPEITNIGFLDGLANEFNFMSYTRLRNGDFVSRKHQRRHTLHPENFTRPLYEAPLHFTSFEVPQKSREKTEEKKIQFNRMLNEGKTIRLKYNENSFLISFISVSYQYQQDIQYSYQLKGFEQNWSAPTKELGIPIHQHSPRRLYFPREKHEQERRPATGRANHPHTHSAALLEHHPCLADLHHPAGGNHLFRMAFLCQ